jgi:hypothetical protein
LIKWGIYNIFKSSMYIYFLNENSHTIIILDHVLGNNFNYLNDIADLEMGFIFYIIIPK